MKSLAFVAMAAPVEGRDAHTGVMDAARAGDLAAFENLMRQYERMVLVTALRLVGNIEDAKDVSQEVFLRLYRNLGKVESEANIPAWLYRVTVNACHDLGRKRKPNVAMEDVPEPVATGANPQESLTVAERQRAVQMSLRALSDKERAVIVLRDLEGLSTEQVAKALGSTEATVRSQVSKGRVKMRDYVERYFRRRI